MLDKDKNDGFYIYTHVRPDTNEVFYVGKGRDNRAYRKSGRNKHWHNIVNKAGGFEVQILAENLIESLALELEVQLIKRFRDSAVNLCNKTDGGEGMSGWNHTEETKKKISTGKRGDKNPNFGRTGEKNPMFGRTGERNPMFGKNLSEESKRKQSEALFKKVHQYTKDNIFIAEYESGKMASEITKTDKGSISKCCKNKLKSAGGFIWRYGD